MNIEKFAKRYGSYEYLGTGLPRLKHDRITENYHMFIVNLAYGSRFCYMHIVMIVLIIPGPKQYSQ